MQSVLKQTVALIDCVLSSNRWDAMQSHSAPHSLSHKGRNVTSKSSIHSVHWQHFVLLKVPYCQLDCVCVWVLVGRHVLYACTHGCEYMHEQKRNRQIHQTSAGFWFVYHQEHPLTENKCLMP